MAKKSTKTVANESMTEVSVTADVMANVTENKFVTNDGSDTATETVAVEPIEYKTVIATVGYGVMLDNVQDYNGTDTYIVKYTGTIGEADCRIISDVC